MGLSSQKNGVAITSVSVKMSLAVSMIGMIIIYNESLTILKICGILLALAGVLLVSLEKSKGNKKNNAWKMLLILLKQNDFNNTSLTDFTYFFSSLLKSIFLRL